MGRTVGREREVLLPISCQFDLPTRARLVFSFGPKPAAHKLLPAVIKRIWLGIAIAFTFVYISPGQFKKSSETNILIIPGKRGPEL